MPILEAAIKKALGEDALIPWGFWQAMDVRTIMYMAENLGMKRRQTRGTIHTAMDDVMKQIEEVQEAWRFLAPAL